MLPFKHIKILDMDEYDQNEYKGELIYQLSDVLNDIAETSEELIPAYQFYMPVIVLLNMILDGTYNDTVYDNKKSIPYTSIDCAFILSEFFYKMYGKEIDALMDAQTCQSFLRQITDRDLQEYQISDKIVKSLIDNNHVTPLEVIEEIGVLRAADLYRRKIVNGVKEPIFVQKPKVSLSSGSYSLALPIIPRYQKALNFSEVEAAHLQMFSETKDLKFIDGEIFIKEKIPFSSEKIHERTNSDNLEKVDILLLIAYFTLIYHRMFGDLIKRKRYELDTVFSLEMNQIIDFFAYGHKERKRKEDRIIESTKQFENIVGVITQDNVKKYFRVFVPEGKRYNNREKKICFSSPYFVKIIEDIFERTRRKNSNNANVTAFSDVIEPSIIEMNARKEHINNVIATIMAIEVKRRTPSRKKTQASEGEQTTKGTKKFQITLEEIVNFNPILEQKIRDKKDRRNEILKRVFEQTFKLLNSGKKYLNFKDEVRLFVDVLPKIKTAVLQDHHPLRDIYSPERVNIFDSKYNFGEIKCNIIGKDALSTCKIYVEIISSRD